MEENVFEIIRIDANSNENAAHILKRIKEFSIKYYNKKFNPGEITMLVLEKILTEIEYQEKGRMFFDTTNNLLKLQVQKYLKKDDTFEIKLKL